MEIGLASKRKLGFVTGAVKRDEKDVVKGEAWDTCNSMIISWILGSVSESIKKSVMFLSNAHQIWRQLEKRFSLTNGSRKYKLNKELYEAKQQGRQVSEYYTMMKCHWGEVDSLNTLPPITTVTAEITSFVEALTQQQDEHKLFQFLNGLDEVYGTQRRTRRSSKRVVEPGERRNKDLGYVLERDSGGATSSTPPTTQCTVCSKTRHTKESCWLVVGFPKNKARTQGLPYNKGKGKNNYGQQKWSKGKPSGVKVAANAQNQNDNMSISSNNTTITAQQLEHLLRLLPTPSKGEDTEDEMDIHYSGMVSCYFADSVSMDTWILDSGTSDHMTGNFSMLKHVVTCKDNSLINLPTGQTSKVTHTGIMMLESNVKLRNVLYIPTFKHNLLYVNKLCEDLKCKTTFLDKYCLIIDFVNEEIRCVGKSANGLYYLINEPVEKTLHRIKEETSYAI
ncbi:uncharacterized protein LOC104883524 [Beta vulgaris subsp. vulgaris]|uniref:uncharacterized protein LOC104883524 n=1 Tax=Beta vulgaris subsp. vulgaris TaxID=3555 RepID=UPI00053FDAF1|nr:uncharacterized protein LOC104883524 [Beta vulgaris subsp. vulgaris]